MRVQLLSFLSAGLPLLYLATCIDSFLQGKLILSNFNIPPGSGVVVPETGLYTYFIVAILVHAHYWYNVVCFFLLEVLVLPRNTSTVDLQVDEISTFLGIRVFHITPKPTQ